MQLQITKEKVLEAASKCSTANATLRVLFPEAFVEPKPVYPLRAGDVYRDPRGNCNPFVLVQVQYNQDAYVLLGLGLIPNSGTFHSSPPHTLKECVEYLEKNKMVYSHNINSAIYRLHNPEYKLQ